MTVCMFMRILNNTYRQPSDLIYFQQENKNSLKQKAVPKVCDIYSNCVTTAEIKRKKYVEIGKNYRVFYIHKLA